MTRVLSVFMTACAVLWICVAHAATTTKQLKWDDLVPKAAALADPLDALTADQSIDFDIMASFRQEGLTERTPENGQAFDDAKESEASLRKQGIDIEAVFQKYQQWQVEKDKQDNALVTELNGSTVKIAGYLLPLDFSDKGVSEFLLVPYVGACIHVPPPPPNQMVFVRLNQSYKAQGLFEPVWVTGEILAEKTQQQLSLADGNSKVPVGYTLTGLQIEPYKN